MVKDLAKLHLGRGLNLNYDTSHHGFIPITIIPLVVDAHREREYEEQVRAQATSTAVADYKSQRNTSLCWT